MTRAPEHASGSAGGGAGGSVAPVMAVRGLGVSYRTGGRRVQVLHEVDLELAAGQVVGVVGESGSGKSTLGLSITRLVERLGGIITPGSSIEICGRSVTQASKPELLDIRRTCVSVIFQDPLSALNPVQTVGAQIIEAMELRDGRMSSNEARTRAIDLLASTGMRDPHRRVESYPHELSGGMRQRGMIAVALASRPALLIADEPTTALDVTIKRRILDVLRELVDQHNLGLVLITHDMATVRHYADRTAVMYAGRVIEEGATSDIQEAARHPYSSALIAAVPRLDRGIGLPLISIAGSPPALDALPSGCSYHPRCPRNDGERCVVESPPARPTDSPAGTHAVRCHHPGQLHPWEELRFAAGPRGARDPAGDGAHSEPILVVTDLRKSYRVRASAFARPTTLEAVSGVSFEVRAGETLGLVGESGSGKTTVARCVTMLTRPTSGTIAFGGVADLCTTTKRSMRRLRRHLQVVFQNPGASLDPRWRVRDLIAEPMRTHGLWGEDDNGPDRVDHLLDRVGLRPADGDRWPGQFSGGQRQRIALARALAVRPRLLVLDEPVSSLDVSIRAGIIGLLQELQDELGLSYLFIAHDLPLVAAFCHRVAVMNAGRVVEEGPVERVLTDPLNDYTKELLAAEL